MFSCHPSIEMRCFHLIAFTLMFFSCEGFRDDVLPQKSNSPHLLGCITRDSNDKIRIPFYIEPAVSFRRENIEFIHEKVFSKTFPYLMFVESSLEKACVVYSTFYRCTGSFAGCISYHGTKSYIYVREDHHQFSSDPEFRQAMISYYSQLGRHYFDQSIFNIFTSRKYRTYPFFYPVNKIHYWTLKVLKHELFHFFNFDHSRDATSIMGRDGMLLNKQDANEFNALWASYSFRSRFKSIPLQESVWNVVPVRSTVEMFPFKPNNDALPELFDEPSTSTSKPSTKPPIQNHPNVFFVSNSTLISKLEQDYRDLHMLMKTIIQLLKNMNMNKSIKKIRKKTLNHHATFDGEGISVKYVSGSFDEKPFESDVLEKNNVVLNLTKRVEVVEAPIYESLNQVLVLEPQMIDNMDSAFIYRQELKNNEKNPPTQPHMSSQGHFISFSRQDAISSMEWPVKRLVVSRNGS